MTMGSIGMAVGVVFPRESGTFGDAQPTVAPVDGAPSSEYGTMDQFEQMLGLYTKPGETDVLVCKTQECDCSWATGGPLGFCSTIGCPCPHKYCWDCCCKNLFPEEYRYAMGMRYLPPMPWWMCFLLVLLAVIIFLSLFIIIYYLAGLDKMQK